MDDVNGIPWLSPRAYAAIAQDAHERGFLELERLWMRRVQEACIARFEAACRAVLGPRRIGGPGTINMEIL
jgi:hypothetical protein